MRLYTTAAGVYVGTQVEAKRDGKGWQAEIVPTDKTGLIDYLNKLKFGDCVDMIEPEQPPLTEDEQETPHSFRQPMAQPAPGYTEHSVAIDDAWEGLPLARKLHFAALAMEEARRKIA